MSTLEPLPPLKYNTTRIMPITSPYRTRFISYSSRDVLQTEKNKNLCFSIATFNHCCTSMNDEYPSRHFILAYSVETRPINSRWTHALLRHLQQLRYRCVVYTKLYEPQSLLLFSAGLRHTITQKPDTHKHHRMASARSQHLTTH